MDCMDDFTTPVSDPPAVDAIIVDGAAVVIQEQPEVHLRCRDIVECGRVNYSFFFFLFFFFPSVFSHHLGHRNGFEYHSSSLSCPALPPPEKPLSYLLHESLHMGFGHPFPIICPGTGVYITFFLARINK